MQGGGTGALVNGVGRIVEAAAPAGTIDGSITVRITGNGTVERIAADGRPYPSYAAYSYTVDNDGNVQDNTLLEQRETQLKNLTQPVRPFR